MAPKPQRPSFPVSGPHSYVAVTVWGHVPSDSTQVWGAARDGLGEQRVWLGAWVSSLE